MRYDERKWWGSGTAVVVWIAVGTVLVHLALGWRYGFDRDELMALEDARHLAWGYVQYPPMTAFLGWVALKLFGTSLGGFRLFASLAQAGALVLTGLVAKEMGGRRWAMVVAALAGVPFCLGAGALMQYISFDYLCWVWVAYCVVKVITGGEKWWLGVGVGMGLGMLAKYTMGFLAVGVVVGVLATDARRYLRSVWLWAGVVVAWVIFLPNLIWQWKRNFVWLDFLKFLHARDVATGVTDWFLLGQLELTMLMAPLALAGIWFCFGWNGRKSGVGSQELGGNPKTHPQTSRVGHPGTDNPRAQAGVPVALATQEHRQECLCHWRILGWMYVVPLVLLLVMRGRDYYLAPAYPMLYAAGAVWVGKKGERVEEYKSVRGATGIWRKVIWVALAVDILAAGAMALPIAPIGSRWWKLAAQVDLVFPDEIGWVEFVQGVAKVRDSLPAEERERVGVLAGNYGEVGALNLYGAKYGLPRAMSGVNSSWERGYGDPPEVLIVVGYPRELLEQEFVSVVVAGRTRNSYGVANEETVEVPEIFVCRGMKGSWEEFWGKVRKYA